MNQKIITIIILSILAIISLHAKENKPIQNKLNELVRQNELPGANFSIIYPDGRQEDFSAGFADLKKKIPMTAEHSMFSGSIGKTYAVALLMQLVDEGKVDLDKKFIEYFSDVSWLKSLPNISEFTVLMLLQHTSGLPRYVHHKEVWETTRNEPDKVWSYKDRLSYIFEDEAVHEAGKGWAYSDTGYLLIGMLVEKFVGNYYETVNKELLVANNLTSTYGAISRDLPNLATGYSDLSDFFAPKVTVENGRYYFNPQMEWTGGGVVSTTSDLAKWAKIYFDGDVFSDSLKQLIITPSEQGKNLDEVTSCGAGGFVYNLKAGKFFGHTGLMPGYRSIFSYSPELDIAIAIQTNCDFGNTKMSLTDFVDFIISND